MKREDLYFELPQELIAQESIEPRDHCKLMVLDKRSGKISHERFFDLANFLKPGDILVFNNSKVLPARLNGLRGDSKRELLLLRELGKGEWEVMIGGKVLVGDKIDFGDSLFCEIIERMDSIYKVRFNFHGLNFLKILNQIGMVPTPPYVKKIVSDPQQYQTVYAKVLGSAAAPTAGLHFTHDLLNSLKNQGVEQEFVTLHVGLGTFQPVKTNIVEEHPIHSEWYSIDEQVFQKLRAAKEQGRRIVAVGTTTVRVLESAFLTGKTEDETALFIYPGFKFQAVDALITNFHTPYSSLLAMVYSFTDEQKIKKAYQEAIKRKYRFFSFGDAMLIM